MRLTRGLECLAYSAQIYFDFSGYSDVALGLAAMFGLLNFNSPYKSLSAIDFWRRWHVTLSRFLRDYLYIPLGGNKKGPLRRYANLFISLCCSGLWHGAGLTFIAWGLLHGSYLSAINHLFRDMTNGWSLRPHQQCPLVRGVLVAHVLVGRARLGVLLTDSCPPRRFA